MQKIVSQRGTGPRATSCRNTGRHHLGMPGRLRRNPHNKIKSLGISDELLREKGAVCCDVAVAMAQGALARSPADLAVSITGVAGPDPDEDGNPVGLVC